MDQPLTDTEREMLELERSWYLYPGEKVNVIRRRFDLSVTQYWQRVNALLDREAALAFDPITIRRLRRLRDGRKPRSQLRTSVGGEG